MSALDGVFLPIVQALLGGPAGTSFGTAATLVKQSNGYIPELDVDDNSPPVSYTISISPVSPYTKKDQYGTLIHTQDLTAITPGVLLDANNDPMVDGNGTPIIPEVGDKIVFQNKTYRLSEVDPIMSGAVTAAFQLLFGA